MINLKTLLVSIAYLSIHLIFPKGVDFGLNLSNYEIIFFTTKWLTQLEKENLQHLLLFDNPEKIV